ncbi:MAG: PilZ domain-containing protein [Terriglobales bacterium]
MHLDSLGSVVPSREYHVRRRDPRYVVSIPVTLQRFARFGPFVTRGMTLDVSVRGMAALVCGTPRVGEMVVIGLSLPGAPPDAPVELLATVRHTSDARTGFEFYPLPPLTEQAIQHWIQELREQEEKLFPFPYVSASAADSH